MSAQTRSSKIVKALKTDITAPTDSATNGVPNGEPPKADGSVPDATVTKNKRRKINHDMGLNIACARVRSHLDSFNVNKIVNAEVQKYKVVINECATIENALTKGKIVEIVAKMVDDKKVSEKIERDITEDERTRYQQRYAELKPQIEDCKTKIDALSHTRTRFSNESAVTLSIICEELIQQLLIFAIKRAIDNKRKIIMIPHLHSPGIEELPLYPLISPLPSFVKTAAELRDEAAKAELAKTIERALAQAEKDFKKKHNIPSRKKGEEEAKAEAPAAVPAPDTSSDESADDDADDDAEDKKTSFKHYIGNVYRALKTKPEYSKMRMKDNLRMYLNDLLTELVHRIADLALITINNMHIKTINDVAIMATVKFILIDGHTAQHSLEFAVEQQVDSAALKEERAKEEAAKKTGGSYTIDVSKIPTNSVLVARHGITYPTSGYATLEQQVAPQLEKYRKKLKET